ncbi:MAG: double zinc ribbon domain-containing protein [Chloroflexota bacterium]
MTDRKSEKKKTEAACHCPYCERELTTPLFPFCGSCGQQLRYCPSCGEAAPRNAVVCPKCGAKQEQQTQ